MPDRMPEDMSEYMPEDMPDRMPDRMPDGMSDRMPEDMPEDLPDRMPEDMPEDMPDRMPNRMSEDMTDRMPEDVPVRTCINVLVGITRSKVIWCSFYADMAAVFSPGLTSRDFACPWLQRTPGESCDGRKSHRLGEGTESSRDDSLAGLHDEGWDRLGIYMGLSENVGLIFPMK